MEFKRGNTMQKLTLLVTFFLSLNLWANETIQLKVNLEIKKCFSDDQDNVCSIAFSHSQNIQIVLVKTPNSEFLTGTYLLQAKLDGHSFGAEVLINKDELYTIANYLHSGNLIDPQSVKVDYLGQVAVRDLTRLNDISWSGQFINVVGALYLPAVTVGPAVN